MTGGKVETRIAAADKDATDLLADVDTVATYKLHNLNRTRLENIFSYTRRLATPRGVPGFCGGGLLGDLEPQKRPEMQLRQGAKNA